MSSFGSSLLSGGKAKNFAKDRKDANDRQKYYKNSQIQRQYKKELGKSGLSIKRKDDGGDDGDKGEASQERLHTKKRSREQAWVVEEREAVSAAPRADGKQSPSKQAKTTGAKNELKKPWPKEQAVSGAQWMQKYPQQPQQQARKQIKQQQQPGQEQQQQAARPANHAFVKEEKIAAAAKAAKAADFARIAAGEAERAKKLKQRKEMSKKLAQRDSRGRPRVRNTITNILHKLQKK